LSGCIEQKIIILRWETGKVKDRFVGMDGLGGLRC